MYIAEVTVRRPLVNAVRFRIYISWSSFIRAVAYLFLFPYESEENLGSRRQKAEAESTFAKEEPPTKETTACRADYGASSAGYRITSSSRRQ
mmetsp:Transcript_1068/g.2245  ORF Transcript_1068/g.2245 Transcript_1068/m.2245 type:complete len:92 (-) Transcript_1068:2000-2275(-)